MMNALLPVIIFAASFFCFGVWVGRNAQQQADEKYLSKLAQIGVERDTQGMVCAVYDKVNGRYIQ
jgi:hypothetical protein